MALIPAQIVPAPAGRGLRYGLFTAATGPLHLPDHARAGGVKYEPVTCGFARPYPVECDTDPPSKAFDAGDPIITAEPFVAYASYVCGSVGYTGAELEAKVRNRLANGEQSIAEQALGSILSGAATVLAGPDPTSIVATVAELEQWLYGSDGASYGQIGFLHAPFRYNAYASVNGLLWQDKKVWRTHQGTVWVFGDYPDDGRIYISGQVNVWRSEDVSVPDPAQTFNRATNQYHLIAEREYAAAYDCVAASAEFAVPGITS